MLQISSLVEGNCSNPKPRAPELQAWTVEKLGPWPRHGRCAALPRGASQLVREGFGFRVKGSVGCSLSWAIFWAPCTFTEGSSEMGTQKEA